MEDPTSSPTRTPSPFERLPVELQECIIHTCWLQDFHEDDVRARFITCIDPFRNRIPAKVFAFNQRVTALSLVNKTLHELCQRYIWRIVYTDDWTGTNKRLVNELESSPRRAWVKALYFQFRNQCADAERSRMMHILEQFRPNLQRLGIDTLDLGMTWLKERGMENLIQYFRENDLPNLTELDIRDTRCAQADYSRDKITTDVHITEAFGHLKNLRHFRAKYVTGVNADLNLDGRVPQISPLAHLLASQKDLVTLFLVKCTCIEDNWNQIEWKPKLINLKLRDVGREFHYDWTHTFVHKFASTLKNLEIWDDQYRWGGQKWSNPDLLFYLPHLERLSVCVHTEQPLDWALMFRHCKNLRRLELNGTEGLENVKKAIKEGHWPKLVDLRVTVMTDSGRMHQMRKWCRKEGYTVDYSEF